MPSGEKPLKTKKSSLVYFALGSNLGDRLENLQKARDALAPAVSIDKCSSIYDTPPWGYKDQPSFLNQVVSGKTTLLPLELLAYLKKTEEKLGRQRIFRYGPRLVDIDILLYDELIMVTSTLVIPHPRMLERGFVLVPLAEIAPDLIIPGTQRSVKEHLQKVDREGIRLVKGT
jgi:2-amino-4-hydroxy-6-hydroxymethyldihydropteridine diphosphokinase